MSAQHTPTPWTVGHTREQVVHQSLRPMWETTVRIKPEPRTIWVNEYPNGVAVAHDSEASARDAASTRATRITVEYREVVK